MAPTEVRRTPVVLVVETEPPPAPQPKRRKHHATDTHQALLVLRPEGVAAADAAAKAKSRAHGSSRGFMLWSECLVVEGISIFFGDLAP